MPRFYLPTPPLLSSTLLTMSLFLLSVGFRTTAAFQCLDPSDHEIASGTANRLDRCDPQNRDALTTCGSAHNSRESFQNLAERIHRWSHENNTLVWLGEFGVSRKAPLNDAVRWIEDNRRAFEEHRIGHALWDYGSGRTQNFSIVDRSRWGAPPQASELMKRLFPGTR